MITDRFGADSRSAVFARSASRLYNMLCQEREMNADARYWTLHWLRVLLWPLPVLSLVRAGRAAGGAIRRR
jgi:hypothetical protein